MQKLKTAVTKNSAEHCQVQIGQPTKSLFRFFYPVSIRRVHHVDDGMRFSIVLHRNIVTNC